MFINFWCHLFMINQGFASGHEFNYVLQNYYHDEYVPISNYSALFSLSTLLTKIILEYWTDSRQSN